VAQQNQLDTNSTAPPAPASASAAAAAAAAAMPMGSTGLSTLSWHAENSQSTHERSKYVFFSLSEHMYIRFTIKCPMTAEACAYPLYTEPCVGLDMLAKSKHCWNCIREITTLSANNLCTSVVRPDICRQTNN